MKKTIAMIMSVGMLAVISSADIIITDNFSYTGELTANGWTAYSGADTSVTSDGNVASVGGGAEDISLSFADQGAGPVFASFTLNVASLPASGDEYSFGFVDGAVMDSRFGINPASTSFGLQIYGNGTATLGDFGTFSLNSDIIVTMYYSGNDDHRMWVNSDGTDFNSPDLQATAAVGGGITGVFLRQAGAMDNGAASWTIDNLVVGTTLGDVVTVVPEPATMSMVLLGLLGARGMIHRRKRS